MVCLMECHHQSWEALKTFKNSIVMFCHATPLLDGEKKWCVSVKAEVCFENSWKSSTSIIPLLVIGVRWHVFLSDWPPDYSRKRVLRAKALHTEHALDFLWWDSYANQGMLFLRRPATWIYRRYWDWMVTRVCFLPPVEMKLCWNTQTVFHALHCFHFTTNSQ